MNSIGHSPSLDAPAASTVEGPRREKSTTPRLRNSLLTRIIGSWAGYVQGDTLVLDRWLWIRHRLPRTRNGERLLDVGCGSGAFTIGSALRGYAALGLTWNDAETNKAQQRATLCKATQAGFETCDVRRLDQPAHLQRAFDYVICCENIEHVIDDRKLFRDAAGVLREGGRLLLTTPNYHYRPMDTGDLGPFSKVENGSHVRRGYSRGQLVELCEKSGFIVEEISYCSGFFSQKITSFLRLFYRRGYPVAWVLTLPLRPFIPMADRLVAALSGYPGYSICLEAIKRKAP